MSIRLFAISFFLLLCISGVYAQEIIPKSDSIELVNGEILEGEVHDDLQGRTMGKIKLCTNKGKDCQKYPLVEVSKITKVGSEGDIKRYKKYKEKAPEITLMDWNVVRYYRVLSFSSEESRPQLSKLLYRGNNLEFYSFKLRLREDQIEHERIYITKPNSSTIIHSYRGGNTKKNIKGLSEYFNDCSDYKNEIEKKNVHKKNPTKYFYELADSCKK